ncbi:MAG TPA: YceI family protein [Mucilaginibacter sp.]|nr:YceI family protein [Mucilaginibacter sp.]
MKNLVKKISVLAAAVAVMYSGFLPQTAKAQTAYKVIAGAETSIKVLGSSNVHDWTETTNVIDSKGNFKFNGSTLESLSSFSFSVPVKSLKSEHSSMNDRTYKALNADKYPEVTFRLRSADVTATQKDKYLIKATGDLTISGASQTVVLNVTATVNADNTITCSGTQKIKLTDFKITPPSFLLGAMKVANDLTIQYNMTYKNDQLISKTN